MQKLLFVAAVISFGVGAAQAFAFAQVEPETVEEAEPDLIHHAYAFGSFVASGIFYSASGWIKRVRRRLAGESVTVDYVKMAKSVMIGVMLGIGAFLWSAYEGDVIAIDSVHGFLTQVGVNTSVILLVDKWILGRTEKVQEVAPVAEDLVEDDDESEELPPGKGGGA